MYCIFYSQFGCLKVTAVLLLVIAASQGSKLDGRANAVEAESDLKTYTWKDVEDYNPEIFQEENHDVRDDDFLNVVQKKRRSWSKAGCCEMLGQTLSKLKIKNMKKACKLGGCSCSPGNGRKLNVCVSCSHVWKETKTLIAVN